MTSNDRNDLRAEHVMREIQSLHAKVDQALQSTIRQNAKINQGKENRIRYSSSLSPSRLKTPSAQTYNPSSQNTSQLKSLHLNIPPTKEFDLKNPKTSSSSSSTSRPKKEDLNLSKFVFFNPFHSPTNMMPIHKSPLTLNLNQLQNIMSNNFISAPQTTRERNINFEKIPLQQNINHPSQSQRQQLEPPKTCRGNIEEQRVKSPLTEVRTSIQNQMFVPKYNKEQLDQIISNIRKRNNSLAQQQQQQLERRNPPLLHHNQTPIAPFTTRNRDVNSCRTSYHHYQQPQEPQDLPLIHQTREPDKPNNETKKIPIKIKDEIFGVFKSQNQPQTLKPLPKEQIEPNKERLESSTLNYQLGSEDWKMYPKYMFTAGDEDVQKILQFFDNPEVDKKSQKTPYPNQAIKENYYCGTLESDTNESLRLHLPQNVMPNPDLTERLRKRNHKRARSECMNIKSIPIKKV